MLAVYGHKWASHLGMAVDANGALSEAAKVWKQGLIGLNLEQIKQGFSLLVLKYYGWPPSLPEFRKLCVASATTDAPSLDETVSALAMMPRDGSIAVRYKHPLIFAVSLSVDMFLLRTAKAVDGKRMVKPVYERLLESGWDDWPLHAHIDQRAIGMTKPAANRSAGLSALREIRAFL
ncbi:MAG: hypothetical protein RIQ94_1858 [Pseudomonadota bacterium]